MNTCGERREPDRTNRWKAQADLPAELDAFYLAARADTRREAAYSGATMEE
jgi:hypothetical protein